MERVHVVLAVVGCLLLAGCAGFGGTEGGAETGSPSVNATALAANTDAVETYSVDITRTLQSTGANQTVEIDGAVDRENEAARLVQTTETAFSDEPRRTEQYVHEGTLYTSSDGEWERSELEDWTTVDHLASAIPEPLASDDLEPVRTETVAGTETTMYEANITRGQAADLAGVDGTGHVPMTIENHVYYVLVDDETDTLYGADLRLEVSQGGDPAFVTIETTITDRDGPVDVELPEEATAD